MLRLLGWSMKLALCLIMGLVVWVAVDSLVRPVSTLMMGRMVTGQPTDRRWVPLSAVSSKLIASVILSEDGQFCRHRGVDWAALKDVVYAGHGRPSRGASTLTMQVAKNLFLWPGRSYIRKGLEIPLALLLDAIWTKKRIFEIYVNMAEWGDGVFGIEAAAQHDFGIRAADLSLRQASLLATALPNPILRRPDKPNHVHRILADRIAGLVPDARSHIGCLE